LVDEVKFLSGKDFANFNKPEDFRLAGLFFFIFHNGWKKISSIGYPDLESPFNILDGCDNSHKMPSWLLIALK
jgi:hypothetical protein